MGALFLSAAELLRQQGRPDSASKKKKKKKKKRMAIFGLDEASGSDRSDDEDGGGGMGGQLRGVKGAQLQGKLDRAMAAHPEEFYADVRRRMLRHLAEEDDGPRRAFQFAQQMPLERQKVLGYFV